MEIHIVVSGNKDNTLTYSHITPCYPLYAGICHNFYHSE
jgi:hypothetical protein